MFSPYDYYVTPEEYEEAARNGLKCTVVNDRIRRLGWSKQKALTLPLQVIYKDRSELYSLAKAHGIPNNLVRSRIQSGWDEIRAATAPIEERSARIERCRMIAEKNRKYPVELFALAAKNGVSKNTFHSRMRKGWDCTRAAMLPPSPKNVVMRLKEKYGDNYFRNMANKMWVNRGRNRFK